VHTPARARPYCLGRSLILCGRAEGPSTKGRPHEAARRDRVATDRSARHRGCLSCSRRRCMSPASGRAGDHRACTVDDIRSSRPLHAKEIEASSMKRSKDVRGTSNRRETAADPRFISALPRCDLWNAVIRCRRQSPAKPMRMGHCEHDTDGLASCRALRSHPFFIGADSLLPCERVSDPRSFSSEFSSEFSTRV